MSRTVEQIRTGIRKPHTHGRRICVSTEGHTCKIDITATHWQTQRCVVCAKRWQAIQKAESRLAAKEKRRSIQARYAIEDDEELRVQVIGAFRRGRTRSQVSEDYGITQERAIEIYCAHYQRRAVMELVA